MELKYFLLFQLWKEFVERVIFLFKNNFWRATCGFPDLNSHSGKSVNKKFGQESMSKIQKKFFILINFKI